MIVSASVLKSALRKLSPVRTESFLIGNGWVSAQDSDVWVVQDSPINGLGVLSVHGKKLTQVVNRMSGQIDVSRDGNKLVLKSAKARVELEVNEVGETPRPADPDDVSVFDTSRFKKVLGLAASSASTNRSVPYGGVVLLQTLSDGGIENRKITGYRAVGTDAVVLTTASDSNEGGATAEFKILLNLPAAAVVQLMDSDVVALGQTGTAVVLTGDGTTIYASKPAQEYPKFDPLISAKAHTRIQFRTEDWLSALKTVEPLIDEAVDKGRIQLTLSGNSVTFQTVGVGSVAADEALYEQLDPDPLFDPKEISLKLKAQHLSGFLSKAGETSVLELTEYPVRFESDGVVVVSMPVKE